MIASIGEIYERDPGEPRYQDDPDPNLSVSQFSSVAPQGDIDGTYLIERCCESSKPLVKNFELLGYKLWIFLLGASLSSERRARMPKYSLSSPLRKAGIRELESCEAAIKIAETTRTCGLYRIGWSNFVDLSKFMVGKTWSISVISKRSDLSTRDNIQKLHSVSGFCGRNPVISVNWTALCNFICSQGDVVVKTIGAYDDRDRSINFIYLSDLLYLPIRNSENN